ncbi:MAG: CTP synthase, partial [Thermodesulfobacteriota bacterium]|nr:CTP synthase [Thermodesulfobacteriota bacterium]
TVAIYGKYTKLEDSYASIIESLNHCSAHFDCRINIEWIETTDIKETVALDGINGVIVPGGFGVRGTEGKIDIIKKIREDNVPFLGLCLGLQLAVVEYARNVCHLDGANSTEFYPHTTFPVIDILPEQKEIKEKGGTMRLGAYEAVVGEGTVVRKLYDSSIVSERHRHRYEVNPEYHKLLTDNGLVFSGMSKDGRLVEFIELPHLKYFVATQAHPELKSRLTKPSPLFYGFVKACLKSG